MKKKGFTLVELLAVIVILAIIAVIATPLILNVIDNAKKGASESSALGYIEGIEKYIVLNEVTKEKDFSFEKGLGYEVESIKDYIEIKGDKPTEGWVCIGDKKEVSKAKLKINNYVIEYKDNKATVVDGEIGTMDCTAGTVDNTTSGSTQEVATNGETYKAIVYLDPTDLTASCNASNSVSTTGTKEGCMKWYAYTDDGTNYKMILDHNTTATVAWNSSGSNASMNEVATALTTDTATWDSSLSPRLIEADEVATITGNTTFSGATSTGSEYFYFETNSTSVPTTYSGNYSWLYDYTYDCTSYGCTNADSSTYGYWTSTPVSGNTFRAWFVNRRGNLDYHIVDDGNLYGVRPVITVSKSVIS